VSGRGSGWDIRMAGPGDMDAVRRLQALPMQGPIRLSLTTPLRGEDRVIIAYQGARLMGMGARRRAQHGWGGRPQWVGVLTSLRSECEVLPRRTVSEMYRQLRANPAGDEPPWELTAILEGNRPARRLLEAGLPGMPRYTPMHRLSTFTFRSLFSSATPSWEAPASELSMEAKAPVPERFRDIGGTAHGCRVERIPGRASVVSGYAPALARLRPVLDPVLRMLGRPGLPSPGTRLREAFVAEARWAPGDRRGLSGLLREIRSAAAGLGAEVVHWGLPSDHPDAPWLKEKSRAWETRSLVYAVHDADVPPPALPDFRPEVSRL
jgi:hypothetical protein